MDYVNVIVGNPPYSGGQKTEGDDNKNVSHTDLEDSVSKTYIKNAPKGNVNHLYNSYIKALRWTSDRIGDSGVIGLITPSAYITGNSEAGIRACLGMEFTDIYCFDLRGDVKGKQDWRREGGKIFGSDSTVGTAITILVKNPAKHHSTIHYHDIGDYMSREEKLEIIKEHGSIAGMEWDIIEPDKYHDWLNKRESSDEWDSMTGMVNSERTHDKKVGTLFHTYSGGILTARDVWVYNTSLQKLKNNMKITIEHCAKQDLKKNFDKDKKYVAWNEDLQNSIRKLDEPLMFHDTNIRMSLYRPFFKQYLYFDTTFITNTYRIPSFYPRPDSKNVAILVPDKIKGEFSTLVTDITPDLHVNETSRCLPLRTKNKNNENTHKVSPPVHQSTSPPVHQSTSPPYENLAIIVPNKIKGEFSVFITGMTPDLQVVANGRVFPMFTQSPEVTIP